jgi:hypothetical protein
MKSRNDKVWWEYFPNLFCTFNLLPNLNNNLTQEINSTTRLIIVIFLIFLVFDFKYAVLFLVISNIFIILYYYQKKRMTSKNENYETPELIENFQYFIKENNSLDKNISSSRKLEKRYSKSICNNTEIIEGPHGAVNNPEWISPSQKLAGGANPKTKIAPVVVAPISDLEYWKANNLVVHSAINDVSNIDVYNSGYAISSCCPKSCDYKPKTVIKENFTDEDVVLEPINPHSSNQIKNIVGTPGIADEDEVLEPISPLTSNQVINNNTSGAINLNCGYYPKENLKANLPTNLSVGICQKSKYMDKFNENLFTQTIQPGVYTKSQVNQPVNSNMGISFTQQIPPTTEQTNNGEIMFTEHDPILFQKPRNPSCVPMDEISESNVYDPRFSGYGTSYRSYIDDTTGQPRFYYKDVDAVRMPNYIVRSKIDNLPFSDQYGPIPEYNSMGNQYHSNIRSMVHDAFTDAAIQHRTGIQQSVMQKINASKWQQRQSPIMTNNQRMLGSCGANN